MSVYGDYMRSLPSTHLAADGSEHDGKPSIWCALCNAPAPDWPTGERTEGTDPIGTVKAAQDGSALAIRTESYGESIWWIHILRSPYAMTDVGKARAELLHWPVVYRPTTKAEPNFGVDAETWGINDLTCLDCHQPITGGQWMTTPNGPRHYSCPVQARP